MLVRLISDWKQSKPETSGNIAVAKTQSEIDINELMENVYYLNIIT